MMTEYELGIAFKEGMEAYYDNVSLVDNPYDGVSVVLAREWAEGFWYKWYSE